MNAPVQSFMDDGIDVIIVKEELAKLLGATGQSKDQVLKAIFERADGIAAHYGKNGSKTSTTKLKERIEHLIELDAGIYGEEMALRLAEKLCLGRYPLGNIIYSRDALIAVVSGNRLCGPRS